MWVTPSSLPRGLANGCFLLLAMPKAKGQRGGTGRGGAGGRGAGRGAGRGTGGGRGRGSSRGQLDPLPVRPGVVSHQAPAGRLVSDLSMEEFLRVVREVVREEQAQERSVSVVGSSLPAASVSLTPGSTSAAASQSSTSVVHVSPAPITSTLVSGPSSVPSLMNPSGIQCVCVCVCVYVWVCFTPWGSCVIFLLCTLCASVHKRHTCISWRMQAVRCARGVRVCFAMCI